MDDSELIKRLDEIKGQLLDEIKGQVADVKGQVADVKVQVAEIKGQLLDEIKGQVAEVKEQIEITETRLLTEFWKWGRTSDVRTRQHASTISAHEERMQILEERVLDLERHRPKG